MIRGAAKAVGMSLHVVALCVLCYIVSAHLVDLTGVLLSRIGMNWIDAVFVASMLGFLYWLIILLWAFSRRGVVRAWLNVGGLTTLTLAGAWLVAGGAR